MAMPRRKRFLRMSLPLCLDPHLDSLNPNPTVVYVSLSLIASSRFRPKPKPRLVARDWGRKPVSQVDWGLGQALELLSPIPSRAWPALHLQLALQAPRCRFRFCLAQAQAHVQSQSQAQSQALVSVHSLIVPRPSLLQSVRRVAPLLDHFYPSRLVCLALLQAPSIAGAASLALPVQPPLPHLAAQLVALVAASECRDRCSRSNRRSMSNSLRSQGQSKAKACLPACPTHFSP